jgi:hypothetical protein
MSTQDERQSLVQEPLPTLLPTGIIPELVLTHIAQLDEEILIHGADIEKLKEDRANALKYAIEHNITEDDQYRLDRVEIPPKQRVDVVLLESRYPSVLNEIRENRAKEFDAKAKALRDGDAEYAPAQDETKIALKKINIKLDAVLYRPGEPVVNWNVVKKP